MPDKTSHYYEFITLTDKEVRTAIKQAKSLGFKVMLKPHVDLLTNSHPDGLYWRGDIGGCPPGATAFTPSEWDAWFESYAKFYLPYAKLAEDEKVDLLSINCELYCANPEEAHWRSVVAKTRAVYKGTITESAMPPYAGSPKGDSLGCAGRTEGAPPSGPPVAGLSWWDAVDVIGMDAYWVLNGTTVAEVVEQWKPHIAWSKALSRKHNKTVTFTEIG